MAQVLNLGNPSTTLTSSLTPRFTTLNRRLPINNSWASLQRNLKSRGRFTCLFSNNNKQEQARKALESALGGKKNEFEKWDKEIKKREEAGGGGDGGGGSWFRWGRWFGGSDGDHFWHEAQQVGLTILGIFVMYLLIAKGDVLLAVVFNPLLFALRGTRNVLTYVTSPILRKLSSLTGANFDSVPKNEVYVRDSAKENVARKWGSD